MNQQIPVILEPPSMNYLLLKKENDFKEEKKLLILRMIFKNIILLYTALFTKHAYPLLSFYNAIIQILIFGIFQCT